MAVPNYSMASRSDPCSIFYRYNIEVEMMHSGYKVALRYKNHVMMIGRELFEDCSRDESHCSWLAKTIHQEWEEIEKRKYQATIPPLGYESTNWSDTLTKVKPIYKTEPEAPSKAAPSKLILLLEDLP